MRFVNPRRTPGNIEPQVATIEEKRRNEVGIAYRSAKVGRHSERRGRGRYIERWSRGHNAHAATALGATRGGDRSQNDDR